MHLGGNRDIMEKSEKERCIFVRRLIAVLLCLGILLCGCDVPQNPTDPTVTQPPVTTQPPETTLPDAGVPETTVPEVTEPELTVILPEPEDGDLVRVLDYIPDARQYLVYGTTENFTGHRIYDFSDAYLRYSTVKKLAAVCDELAEQGLGILIWDGFRPVYAQARLWEIYPDPNYVSKPDTGFRGHCRGSAVDLTLVELASGEILPMPTGFDDFTALADRDYSDCDAEAAANARLLEDVMERHGFVPYSKEWWHFTDTVQYDVDENFDPASHTLWYANCREYISLREAPDGDVITTIPAGDVVKLRGWDGKFARVQWQGLEGYVLSSYIRPAGESILDRELDVVKITDTYTYESLCRDLAEMARQWPEQVSLDTIGVTALDTPIPVLRIGDADAHFHVLLQAAVHGREHMTAWLLTAMADYWLGQGIAEYGDICWHFIPMVNPDGVRISQTGLLTDAQREIYKNDLKAGYTTLSEEEYARSWKANALGEDINRNFPAGWEFIDDRTGPSSARWQGAAPFSAAEAAALRDYTLAYDFDVTISIHSSGSIIYYEYGSRQPANELSEDLGNGVGTVAGYPLEGCHSVDGAGYKDWAIDSLGIPSLTIEIGCGESALEERELYSIFMRTYRLPGIIARWLQT